MNSETTITCEVDALLDAWRRNKRKAAGMKRMMRGVRGWAAALVCAACGLAGADELLIQSFDGTGQLTFNTLNDGTNYNYRVEWAPAPSGPWSTFEGARPWLDVIQGAAGGIVTSAVPMCYRVVATRGEYLAVDLSGGTNAASYPVAYYRTLADVPGGPNSDAYKTTSLLMRLIPKGRFTMGSPSVELGWYSDETQHPETLAQDFHIGVFEVTQRQWELVMGKKPSFFTNVAYYASRPVEQVSYYDIRENPSGSGSAISPNWPATNAVGAASFMGRMRAKTGMTFDLPTEAQWEYACRAGTTTALNSGKNLASTAQDANMSEVGRNFHNGPSTVGYGKAVDTSGGTAKAGSYQPSARGLYDMHGNVKEWCLDWYPGYEGTFRILRGGGWLDDAESCRAACRFVEYPSARYNLYGFRAVLPSSQQ